MQSTFTKPFTQQEAIPEAAIERVAEIMRTGRLHRYNTVGDELSEAAQLEAEYAAYQGAQYCVAVTSGGYACAAALRALGLTHGDKVLMNAWTLAPVPGAVHSVGGVPVMVDIGQDLRIDTDDLEAKALESGAKFLMLSHMRGHIGNMERIVEICERHGIAMVEDCAHTMGAQWNGSMSGNFGRVAAFSTQTYKHMNSGEGGLLTTNDPEVAARLTMLSGSYMIYGKHGAGPDLATYADIRLDTPNCSGRMDNIRAAILRAQLADLDAQIARWNARYQRIEAGLANAVGIDIIPRPQQEFYVGSSIQFHASAIGPERIPAFVDACLKRGVEIKWFGAADPVAFTSRYDSWRYLGKQPKLPVTLERLSTLCDLRVPLTFTLEDCDLVAEIIADEAKAIT